MATTARLATAVLLAAGGGPGAPHTAAAAEPAATALHPGPGRGTDCPLAFDAISRAVAAIVDAETLRLDDGREVRLIGAMAPRLPDIAASDTSASGAAGVGAWPAAAEAHRQLERIALGRTVRLGFAGPRNDRYGRLLAHVFATDDTAGGIWVQGEMLAAGQARAYDVAQRFACSAALVAAEAIARDQKRGIWSNAAYQPRAAHRTGELLRLAGTFQLVEGVVHRAARSKDVIYVNFGRDRRQDFSLAVTPDAARMHPAWASSLLDLSGRRIRARGWIVRRNGPLIEIEAPGQIEVLSEDGGHTQGQPEESQQQDARADGTTATATDRETLPPARSAGDDVD